jgi:NADH-ubiquinone oxidoreductase chain 4
VIYASFSTLRTTDIKELIAYSSVSHAAIYILGAFSNSIQGIEGSIILGLAHGLVSSGLFICVGGVLYDRTGTRLISYYRGLAQTMPVFSIIFFILCLGNCGAPLTLNFLGEFLSLAGTLERLPVLGILACSSIVLSAAYTIYMYNRIVFAGSSSLFLDKTGMIDLSKRELCILLSLVVLTVLFGIFPSYILDGLHVSVSTLIYSINADTLDNTDVVLLGSGLLCIKPITYPSKVYLAKRNLHIKEDNKLSEMETAMRPYFVTGFTDGEGSFVVTLIKSPSSPVGYKIQLSYRIGLHNKDLALLESIKKFFKGLGGISSTKNTAVYYISSIKDLEVVVNHFDKYPLITNKLADYMLFKQAFNLISTREHITQEGFNKIVAIKSVMNKGLSDELKKFTEISFIQRPAVNLPDFIHPD